MPEKKQESFTVTDRRLFTSEGEVRKEVVEEHPVSTPPVAAAPPAAAPETGTPEAAGQEEAPAPPTAAEQREQAEAYSKSSKEMDTRVELSGHSAKELEMTFE